jgi:hypothetical protein
MKNKYVFVEGMKTACPQNLWRGEKGIDVEKEKKGRRGEIEDK